MSGLNLNRDRVGLLQAISAGQVFRNPSGQVFRQEGERAKYRVDAKVRELQQAGLVDDELRLTDDGVAAAKSGPASAFVPRFHETPSIYAAPRLAATNDDDAPAPVTSIVRWEEPPPAQRRRNKWKPVVDWHRIAAQLRDRPHAWALVMDSNSQTSTPSAIRGAQISTAFRPAGSFDAVSVRVGAELHLYVRYVGGEPS